MHGMLFMSVVIILTGLWVFSSKRKHLLATLLSLEFMVLGVYFLCLLGVAYSFYYFSLLYLVVTVCEGALGLTILVSMSRTHGGDYFSTFHLDYMD